MIELPPFKPNKYLFETHKDKGKEEWEIYAWAVRDVMSKVSGKPTIEVDVKEKAEFKKFMTGKTDVLEKGDFRLELPPIRKKRPENSKKDQ